MSKWRRIDKALAAKQAIQESQKPKIIRVSAAVILFGVFITITLSITAATAGNYALREAGATRAANRFASQLQGHLPLGNYDDAGQPTPTANNKQAAFSVPHGVEEGNRFIVQSSGANTGGTIYDPLRRIVKIVETSGGSVTSTKQFVWADDQLCEERDGAGNVTRRFFHLGEQIAGVNYYYTGDHLDSVREMTNSAGTIQAQYGYSPWGDTTKLAGTGPDSDMQFAGMYKHQRSGLNLALCRPYNPLQGKWLSRDPVGENAGTNLFAYVGNNPVSFVDPLGLDKESDCLDKLKGCLKSCLTDLKTALGPDGFSIFSAEMSTPILKKDIGVPTLGGASKVTTIGSVIGNALGGKSPLPGGISVPTPTFNNPAAMSSTTGSLMGRALPMAGLAIGLTPTAIATKNYVDCSNKCNDCYKKCLTGEKDDSCNDNCKK